MTFLPHEGSYFDDLRADDDRHEAKERKKRAVDGVDDDMTPMYLNLRNRPHALVFVKNDTVRKGTQALLREWKMPNSVMLDPRMRVTDIRVSS